MTLDKKTELAVELHKLGVSQDGIVELLWQYPVELIEKQLMYLPYRKAKRKEAFIVEAIRKNYTAPKEFFYAQAKADLAAAFDAVDQGAEPPLRPTPPESQGHGAENPPPADPPNFGLEQGKQVGDLDLPDFDQENWQGD